MKSFAVLAMAGAAVAQGVTQLITPSAGAPSGCSASFSGQFEITTVVPNGMSKRDWELVTRQSSNCGQTGILTIGLSNGILTDNQGRTGYIASNYQFQFDKPPQTGAIYTGGFSSCSNGTLAIGGSTLFYSCASVLTTSNTTIYNLYTQSVGAQCTQANIMIVPCSGGSANSGSAAPASVSSDGQPQGTAAPTSVAPVSVTTDGQPQATVKPTSVAPVSVFTDGQPQATANVTVAATPKPTIAAAGGAFMSAPAAFAMVAGAAAALFL